MVSRCQDGASMTVNDPAGDALTNPPASSREERAVLDNLPAFDIRRVTISTTDRWLCVSVFFAAGDPPLERPDGFTERGIRLDLASVPLSPLELGLPGRISFGFNDQAQWLLAGQLEPE